MSLLRRDILKLLGLSTSGLVVPVIYAQPQNAHNGAPPNEGFDATPFLHLAPSGQLTFVFPRAEMGQGAIHGLTTIVAEELQLDPHTIEVVQAPADPERYGNPVIFGIQITGGSTSLIAHYDPLRQAGAQMRTALLMAASADLAVPLDSLALVQGRVVTPDTEIPWGRFCRTAASQPLPTNALPVAPAQWRQLGQSSVRIDSAAKATGTATFGTDIDFDNLHRAVVVRGPVIDSRVTSFNRDEVLTLPGITDVIEIFSGVAIVGTQKWYVDKAAKALKVEWDAPAPLRDSQSANLAQSFAELADRKEGVEVHKEGEPQALLNGAQTITRDYYAPYLAHATMEPMSVTVRIEDEQCDIWTGTQAPDIVQAMAVSKLDIAPENVRVHNCMLGGGFGRRTNTDYIREGLEIAQQVNKPVQCIWTREDDLRNDYYRPAALVRYQAALSETGKLSALKATHVGPQIMQYSAVDLAQAKTAEYLPEGLARWVGKRMSQIVTNHFAPDESTVEGLLGDYDYEHKASYHVQTDPGLRLGYWRSVGHSYTAFAKECLMDELATDLGEDPIAFRLRHLRDNPRLAGVLQEVAAAANWQQRRNQGEWVGVAAHTSFGTAVAQIARVELIDAEVRVTDVWCAIDCGLAVNPDVVRAQMESGILFGLSAALWGDITLVDGAVQESNFHNYRIARMHETPRITVRIINSADRPLGGVGEPGTPPIAPAIANAIYQGTQQRLRALPLRPAV
jgi:CO/xanthine dehydrogenase Mo-binding subunit